MSKKFVVLALALGFCVGATAYAYDQNAATKLGRGLVNDVTFWIELPKQIYLDARASDPFTGIVYGAIHGSCYSVLRLAAGVYDTTFFFLPPYDKPIIEKLVKQPEFVYEGWIDE
jgi:putative exosortase-associated protein (TIGR04073 family)